MKKWKILADSGCDYRQIDNLSKDVDYDFVPLMLNIDNQVIIDDGQIELNKFIDLMDQSKQGSSSACPSPDAYARHFQGAENVIVFTLTGALSGSYNSAHLGREIALEENPNQNIHIFDSRSASGEMNLLVDKAIELAESGVDFETMVEAIHDYHQHTRVYFLIEDINNLAKNGRVNKVVAHMVGMLNIRLIGVRSPQGTIDIVHKPRGSKRAFKALVEAMVDAGYQGGKVSITHVNNPSGAQEVAKQLTALFPKAHIQVQTASNLCAYYGAKNGLIIGVELEN